MGRLKLIRKAAVFGTAAAAALAATLLPASAAEQPPAPATHPAAVAATPAAAGDDWLHTEGNQIVDAAGHPVWLTGVNWFGFNATERVFHGLWSVNLEDVTRSMANRGINIVRVPISTQLLKEWSTGRATAPSGVNLYANPELTGLTSLGIFDAFLDLCEEYGLKVMLDVHSAEADNSGHVYPVWWRGDITVEDFYSTWEWVAERYANNDTLVAMDIKNEPHGTQATTPRAKWDSSTDQDNFKHTCETAGRRILDVSPNVLILCEGIEIYPRDGAGWESANEDDYHYNWWGGNLRGVRDHPVDLGAERDQLVYSPHDYGPLVHRQPWFEGDFSRETLERDVWDPNWLYLHKENTAPLFIGEWGGFMDGGDNERWMTALRDLIADERLHHTFWCLNPNSGDTGGLLGYDWQTWDEEKYALLKPALWQHEGRFVGLDHQVPLGGEGSTTGISLGERYGNGPGPDPDPEDTQSPTTPQALRVTSASDTSVTLAWNAATDNVGVTAYDVYRNGTRVGGTATTSFQDTGLAAETAYRYTVRARDAAGNASPLSAALTATTADEPDPDPAPVGTLLSQGRNAWSSSAESGSTGPDKAVDGQLGTRWTSGNQSEPWMVVDLGSTRTINGAKLDWHRAPATGFRLQVSDNGGTWTTLHIATSGSTGPQSLTVSGSGRFVRLIGQGTTALSINELQIYGS